MKNLSILFFLFIAVKCNATIFPRNGEMTYKYYATVQNTISSPEKFTSHYEIHANVDVHHKHSVSTFALRNVITKDTIGKHEDVMSAVIKNGIQESKYLEIPFQVYYFENGTVDYLNMSVHDATWSRNIKKGIASLFQLDNKNIKTDVENRKYSFHSYEQTLSGECGTRYNVDSDDDQLRIIKTFEDCNNQWQIYSSFESEITPEEIGKSSRYRIYDISREDDDFKITSIESNWKLLFYAENKLDSVHSISIDQMLMSTKSSQETINMTSETMIQTLSEHADMDSSLNAVYGSVDETRTCDIDHLQRILKDMVDYMENGHVTFEKIDWNQTNNYRQIMNLFGNMKKKCLYTLMEHLKSSSEQNVYELYMNILPFIGTRASTLFIYDLIKEQKITPSLSQSLIKLLPFFIKFMPDREFLKEFSGILKLPDYIAKDGLLAFSTIISKSNTNDGEPYVRELIEKFHSCENYNCQLLYIFAMGNTKSKEITKVLKPIIRNEFRNESIESSLRNTAMWVTLNGNKDLIHETCWPILLTNTEDLEIRISALKLLMTDKSMDNLLNLEYSLREDLQNEHLYNVFYTALKEIEKTPTPDYNLERKNVENILQYISQPAFTSEEAYEKLYNFYNEDLQVGVMLQMSAMESFYNKGIVTYFAQLKILLPNKSVNIAGVHLRIQMSENVKKTIMSVWNTIDYLNMKNIKNILPALMKLGEEDIKGSQFEMTILHKNQVIGTTIYSSLNDIMEELKNLSHSGQTTIHILFAMMAERIAVTLTDIGTPVMNYIGNPLIFKINSDVKSDHELTIKMEEHLWSTGIYEMQTLNPLNNKWYGSRKQAQMDARIPLHIKIHTKEDNVNMMIMLKEDKFFGEGFMGAQRFIESQVYVFDDITKTYHNYLPVTKGLPKQKKSLWSVNVEDTGMTYEMAVFDCEHVISSASLNNIKNGIIDELDTGFAGDEFLEIVMGIEGLWAHIMRIPNINSCGIGMQIRNTKKEASDITIELGNELLNVEIEDIYPKGSVGFTFNFALKNQDDVITGWNASCIVNTVGDTNPENSCLIKRINQNQQEYDITFNMKTMLENNTETYDLTVKYEDNRDPSVISVQKRSTKSKEQLSDKNIVYSECETKKDMNSLNCIVAKSSLRHEDYEIQYKNFNKGFDTILETFYNGFKNIYNDYYVKFPKLTQLDKGSMEVNIDYNVASKDSDIVIRGPFESFGFTGIPNNEDIVFGLVGPKSTINDDMENSFVCEISKDNYFINQYNKKVIKRLTDLQLFCQFDYPEASISATKLKGKLFLRYTFGEVDVLEVSQDEGAINMEYNGEKISINTTDDSVETIGYVEYKMLSPNQMIIAAPKITSTIVSYTKDKIYIYADRDNSSTGSCFE